jgi:hypothetical protein
MSELGGAGTVLLVVPVRGGARPLEATPIKGDANQCADVASDVSCRAVQNASETADPSSRFVLRNATTPLLGTTFTGDQEAFLSSRTRARARATTPNASPMSSFRHPTQLLGTRRTTRNESARYE